MNKTLIMIGFFVFVLAAVLSIPCASAKGGVFVIPPKQEVIEDINATITQTLSMSVAGNVSANDTINLYILSPAHTELLCCNTINQTEFNFEPKENGTYQIHLVNTHSDEMVTAALSCGFNYQLISIAKLQLNSQAGASIISTQPISPPNPDDPRDYLENLYAKFLNFLKSSEILRSLEENLQEMSPINDGAACLVEMFVFGMVIMHGIVKMRLRATVNKISCYAH
jgi:hypothetical protein